MSLRYIPNETQTKKQENGKSQNNLEAIAQEFDKIAGMNGNREGRLYLKSLNKDAFDYIMNNPRYNWRAEAVMKMRG